jgi:3-oxoacyl-[acyl-carrier-protein] synthase II
LRETHKRKELADRLIRLGVMAAGSDVEPAVLSSLEELLDRLASLLSLPSRPQALKRRRVVITGLGAVTPLGIGVEPFWRGLIAGQSGIDRMTLTDPSNYPCQVAGEVRGFDPLHFMEAKEARRMSRATQFAVAAAKMAIEDSGIDLSSEDLTAIGVILGTGTTAFPETEAGARTMLSKGGMRLSPFFVPIVLPNMPACQVSIQFGLRGYNSTITTACAASTQSIGEAYETICRGDADIVLSGGAEAPICELGLAGFSVMRALSTHNDDPPKASRPFDATRNGFVPGEGAGIVVLEELQHAMARGARIYAEVAGYASSSDAYHVTAPDPDGDGAAQAMALAVADAGLRPEDIDYINAHGTGTPLNDAVETKAIKRVFGDHAYKLAISSTKSMIGHLLGGAGGVEAVATVLSVYHGIVHPTINLHNPDPECDLDYVPNEARVMRVRAAMSNSFGFGGQNACLVIKAFEP